MVYNSLADIISRIMAEVEADSSFENIVQYLFKFVDKEKQSENMLDKLCQRFTTTDKLEEWRRLAYCVSLCNMSEKGLKRVSENFKCFSSCIVDDIVFGHFDAVLAKARKFAKPEAKAIVDDLDAKLQAALSDERAEALSGLAADKENSNALNTSLTSTRGAVADKKKPVRSKGAKAKAATKPLAKAAKTRSSARRRRKDSSDDDDGEAEEDDDDDDALVA